MHSTQISGLHTVIFTATHRLAAKSLAASLWPYRRAASTSAYNQEVSTAIVLQRLDLTGLQTQPIFTIGGCASG